MSNYGGIAPFTLKRVEHLCFDLTRIVARTDAATAFNDLASSGWALVCVTNETAYFRREVETYNPIHLEPGKVVPIDKPDSGPLFSSLSISFLALVVSLIALALAVLI